MAKDATRKEVRTVSITPDSRVVLTAHGSKGTVLEIRTRPDADPYAVVDFDGVGINLRNLDLLTPIDEPAPAPKLYSAGRKGVYEFYTGGVRYEVANTGGWTVTRMNADGPTERVVPYASTRKAAFAQALAIVTAA